VVDGGALTGIATGGTLIADPLIPKLVAITHARHGLPMKIGKVDAPVRLWLFGVLFPGLAVASVIGEIGPGRWANRSQDAMLGGHSGELSVLAVIVMFLEIAFLGIVGRIAGRPVVRLRARKKKSTQDAKDTDPIQVPGTNRRDSQQIQSW